jgi:hypothetical protein
VAVGADRLPWRSETGAANVADIPVPPEPVVAAPSAVEQLSPPEPPGVAAVEPPAAVADEHDVPAAAEETPSDPPVEAAGTEDSAPVGTEPAEGSAPQADPDAAATGEPSATPPDVAATPPGEEQPAAPPADAAPAPSESTAEPSPGPETEMVASVAPAPPAEPLPPAEQRLAALDPATSARLAVETILSVWRVRPLADEEWVDPKDLSPVAQRRFLEELRLDANASMLRLLDLPAVLELAIPGSSGTRYATLTGMQGDRCVLAIGEESMTVEPSFLERFWVGEAHVFWRDFETLGRTFGVEASGPQVVRLQRLLRRIGAYQGEETGFFDPETINAVLDFQRTRSLEVDGRVGRLTRIVLYAAAGGYPRPTLAGRNGASS